jgi:hypothetical protein
MAAHIPELLKAEKARRRRALGVLIWCVMSKIVKQARPVVTGRPAGQLHGSPTCKWCKDIAGIIRNVVLVTPHVKEFLGKLSAIWARAVIKGSPALS